MVSCRPSSGGRGGGGGGGQVTCAAEQTIKLKRDQAAGNSS